MNRKFLGVAGGVVLLVGLAFCVRAMLHNDVYVAEFPENKAAAVSFTFDDGCPSTFSHIVPMLEAYHRKATFFVIPSTNFANDGWKQWKALSDSGFEIGNHTLTHPDLTLVDTARVRREVLEGSAMIQAHIGIRPVSFAHPHHHTSEAVDDIVSHYHAFTRVSPDDFCDWHGWVSTTTEEEVKQKIDRAVSRSGWYVVAAHGLGDGWEPVSESLLRQALDYVQLHNNDIIVDTFGHIGQYRLERDHTKVLTTHTKDHTTISLVCDLPQASCIVPLTVVIKNKNGRVDFKLTSATGPVRYTVRESEILAYAMPNSTLEISWPSSRAPL